MSGSAIVTPSHLRRAAFVYLRQSSPAQVTHHRESTAVQYALVERAAKLGWPRERIDVLDADLGVSAAGVAERHGFARLIGDIAAGEVGIVLALDPSRLARNSTDWHRLLQSCAVTDTLIGDADGIYRPNSFNDRLLLIHKGLISEAELHQLRVRLDLAIRSKAARGALRRRLPVGLVWSANDGEIRFHPDPAVGAAIGAVFERYAGFGSVRRVRLSFEAEGRLFPRAVGDGAAIEWVAPRDAAIRSVLTNPAYAGAYAYGRSRRETRLGEDGGLVQRVRRLPRAEWAVLIPDHHRGFIDWATWEANQRRLSFRIGAGEAAESADPAGLLAGLARCGRCGGPLRLRRRPGTAEYRCSRRVRGTARPCLGIAAAPLDAAVDKAAYDAPAGDMPRRRWAGADERRDLLRQRLAEIVIAMPRGDGRARAALRWRDGSASQLDFALPAPPHAATRTDAGTVALVRRLAPDYPDSFIAAVLNREDRRTSYGYRFTARHVGSLRRHWRIPSFARRSRR